MDPFNPQFANDAAMKLYREKVKQYEPDADIDNGIVAYGWTQGALLVKVLGGGQEGHPPRRDGRGPSHGQTVTGGLLLERHLGHHDGTQGPVHG